MEISSLKKQIKDLKKELDEKAIAVIPNLSDEQIITVLKEKWIAPILNEITNITTNLVGSFVSQLEGITKKYANPVIDLDKELLQTENNLAEMLSDLTGDDFDMKAILELKKMMGDHGNGEK